MNVISNNESLDLVFSYVYEDLTKRKTLPWALVFQSFDRVWNIGTLNGAHNVNIGESYRHGVKMIFIQARKPQQPGVTAAEKYVFKPTEITKLSFLISYYLLAARGHVNLPELNRKYPELSPVDRMNLRTYVEGLQAYIKSGQSLVAS